jgi:hypothetical protein
MALGPERAKRLFHAAQAAFAAGKGRGGTKTPWVRVDLDGHRLRIYDMGVDRFLVADLDHPENLTTVQLPPGPTQKKPRMPSARSRAWTPIAQGDDPHLPRFGVLPLTLAGWTPRGYVIYDRATGCITDGVYFDRALALDVCAFCERNGGGAPEMTPTAEALGLLFPAKAGRRAKKRSIA